MKASLKAYALAKGYEGWSAVPYLCPGGKWTIGWGHTQGVTAHTPAITEAQGELYLAHDIIEAERIVERAVTVSLNQNEFDALVLFVMNIGPGQAGVKSGLVELKTGGPSTLLRRLNENDRAGAADVPGDGGRSRAKAAVDRRRERDVIGVDDDRVGAVGDAAADREPHDIDAGDVGRERCEFAGRRGQRGSGSRRSWPRGWCR